jgi:uncharacterized protein YjbI with pentapeptide repeats
MVKLEKLLGQSGKVHELLGLSRSSDGYFDLSNANWKSRIVLSDLNFEGVRVASKVIGLNIVNSKLRNCHFENIGSDNSFWGANNEWSGCVLKQVSMHQAICPQNRFDSCRFESMNLVGSSAYETTFTNCVFEDLQLEGFRAERSRQNGKPFADIPDASLTFKGCQFLRPRFCGCRFDNIEFSGCAVIEPKVIGSNVAAAKADTVWWRPDDSSDPFIVVLDKILAMLEVELGRESKAYLQFARYRDAYLSGSNHTQDFSACLYSKEVPDCEIESVEESLHDVSGRYAWLR